MPAHIHIHTHSVHRKNVPCVIKASAALYISP